jgi:hypothetical protein
VRENAHGAGRVGADAVSDKTLIFCRTMFRPVAVNRAESLWIWT